MDSASSVSRAAPCGPAVANPYAINAKFSPRGTASQESFRKARAQPARPARSAQPPNIWMSVGGGGASLRRGGRGPGVQQADGNRSRAAADPSMRGFEPAGYAGARAQSDQPAAAARVPAGRSGWRRPGPPGTRRAAPGALGRPAVGGPLPGPAAPIPSRPPGGRAALHHQPHLPGATLSDGGCARHPRGAPVAEHGGRAASMVASGAAERRGGVSKCARWRGSAGQELPAISRT